MADKYRVGQLVRLINIPRVIENQRGLVFSIKEPRRMRRVSFPGGLIKDSFVYVLSDDQACPEEVLEPVYDGDNASTWEECLWKPKPVKQDMEHAAQAHPSSLQSIKGV